jgi:hypothetical protein
VTEGNRTLCAVASYLIPLISGATAALGIVLGAWLTRRQARRAQAERLFVEALNDAVAAIAAVAGGAGQAAQRQYAGAMSRIALHASPVVVAAFRRFQDDATTATDSGRERFIAAVHLARRELGHEAAGDDDLSILLFGGPIDVELWDRVAERVSESAPPADTAGSGSIDDELEHLAELAYTAPVTTVMRSFALIERALQRIADVGGLPNPSAPAAALADMAERAGLITRETLSAVRGLVALRNFSVHARSETEVTPERAREYVALVQAVLFALSRPPQPTNLRRGYTQRRTPARRTPSARESLHSRAPCQQRTWRAGRPARRPRHRT